MGVIDDLKKLAQAGSDEIKKVAQAGSDEIKKVAQAGSDETTKVTQAGEKVIENLESKGVKIDSLTNLESNIETILKKITIIPPNLEPLTKEIENINIENIFSNILQDIPDKIEDIKKVRTYISSEMVSVKKDDLISLFDTLNKIYDLPQSLIKKNFGKDSPLLGTIDYMRLSFKNSVELIKRIDESYLSYIMLPKQFNLQGIEKNVEDTLAYINQKIVNNLETSANNLEKYAAAAISEIRLLIKFINNEFVHTMISLVKKAGEIIPLPLNVNIGGTAGPAVVNGAAIIGTKIFSAGKAIASAINVVLEFVEKVLDFIDLRLEQIQIIQNVID